MMHFAGPKADDAMERALCDADQEVACGDVAVATQGQRLLESINIPFYSMGNITSRDLFCENEKAVFDFYWRNRHVYKRFCDMGANIGLHSIYAAKLGWDVRSFEPDLKHRDELRKNMFLNNVSFDIWDHAVSTHDGVARFVRVMDNQSANHIAGAKQAYGPLEETLVLSTWAQPHIEWADLIKMDIEGHEAEVICSLPPDIWKSHHLIVEVGSIENAARIYNHIPKALSIIRLKDWQPVMSVYDMPTHHSHGNLFIGWIA